MRKLINNTQKSPNKKSDFNALRQNSKMFFLGKISVILLETSGYFAKILNNNKLKTSYNNDFRTYTASQQPNTDTVYQHKYHQIAQ